MIKTKTLTPAEIEDLSMQALLSAGTSENNARPLAKATAVTEAYGVASHGLAYIPIYCEHVRCGKVDGQATPILDHARPGLLKVDAATGFAHPAIELGFKHLVPTARKQGIAGLAIHNSYNCGVLGCHTEQLARMGLLGIGFTNAPASIAPSGGSKPVIGTNPFSIAAPGDGGAPVILIDQSASAIAKSEVMKHAREGRPIPQGWALDCDGNPTTDPEIGLKGSMAPSGGYKGVGVGLMVEIMAAAMTGATLGIEAAPFSGDKGGPPKTGQFFLAIDPEASSGGHFARRINALAKAIHDQEGAHLPGDGRSSKQALAQTNGVAVSVATLAQIQTIIDAS